ncbi:uncharacterized protein SPSK_04621 [Sporothrix schenckii 1099-18]|uniref:Uncharacterized protein n=1 Tax=Sporothrix schenckii 1099-18 TaxID=1397361 RepID=A0A0F2M0X1_SPOSC|nr:uncharacterized protein SPSK_04621 [Sporothrix schenckii 1099-18]KJR83352.1 hypothetical protein SPSK_04621 [Sporothrix schenckii 1099-18]
MIPLFCPSVVLILRVLDYPDLLRRLFGRLFPIAWRRTFPVACSAVSLPAGAPCHRGHQAVPVQPPRRPLCHQRPVPAPVRVLEAGQGHPHGKPVARVGAQPRQPPPRVHQQVLVRGQAVAGGAAGRAEAGDEGRDVSCPARAAGHAGDGGVVVVAGIF